MEICYPAPAPISAPTLSPTSGNQGSQLELPAWQHLPICKSISFFKLEHDVKFKAGAWAAPLQTM